MPFKAKYTKAEIVIREGVIIEYIVSLSKDARKYPNILPYFLEYGIIDWSWPCRFHNGNQPFKAYKYYSKTAHDAVLRGETKFTRDHIIPKKILKEMIFNLQDPDSSSVRQLMEKYGEVCVITRDENNTLNQAGLNRMMPIGWEMNDSIFSRYDSVGIQIWSNDLLWR